MSLPSEMRALMARGVKDYALQNIAVPPPAATTT